MPALPDDIMRRAARVRLLCLDVDGTLTDGRLYPAGDNFARRYSVIDGFGVRDFINKAGGVTAIISAALTEEINVADIRLRARQMQVKHVQLDCRDKPAALRQLMDLEGLTPEQVAYAGDDSPDVAPMRLAGFACAPPSACDAALQAAHYVTRRPAGGGAVREICDILLQAQGVAL